MAAERKLEIGTLEGWLWEAACTIRGPVDAPKFKDFILPLVFLKRISDVYDDEVAGLVKELPKLGGPKKALKFIEKDPSLVRFLIPEEAHWSTIKRKTTGLGQLLTDAMRAVARKNPKFEGAIDVTDFNATAAGQRIIEDRHLADLVQVLSRYRLGLDDVEPDILGRAYEYLLRRFAEGQGQAAGEFYTPRPVTVLMSHILEPAPGMEIYDPCCGSSGLLIKCHLRLLERLGRPKNGHLSLPPTLAPLQCYGQEINPATFALSKMNVFIHDMEKAQIRLGDTMHRPVFTNPDGSLQRFDLVTANPMWNQDFPLSTYDNDPYERFRFGAPPASSADWGWIQHMFASLKDRGRMAVVLDTGAVSRGSGNRGSNRERHIRRAFVDKDLVEAVLLLPENMFYNTTAPANILVINRKKRHRGEILLINASKQFTKGRPKNELADEHVERIAALYRDWRAEERLSVIVKTEEVARNDYNLSPSSYVSTNGKEEVLPLEEAVVLLKEAEEERAAADGELQDVLAKLGFGGQRGE